ncbi:MAG TPA: nuclear transport factor 2 family protein [Roseiflexaceae bacterium]|nr:nuclear transport factor 2 family protein [Roseiflexaceae bacterium]
MEQSTELIDLTRRSYEALSSGDIAFFERHVSQDEGVLAIGTDPNEWWSEYATIIRVFKIQLEEMGPLSIDVGTLNAYSDGNVGWAAGRLTLRLADGTAVPLRVTSVYQRQQGDWKIVQWHGSAGVPNADVIGKDLTTE